MNIGIITMWNSKDNYGQVLQCYALQHYLREQGHNAFLIKSISDAVEKKSLNTRFLQLPGKIFSYRFWSLLIFRFKLKQFSRRYGHLDRGFDYFRTKFIVSTDKIYDIAMLEDNPPLCDAYITGSDQVWGALSKVYFLTFVHDKPKYSYAASFGSNPFTIDGRKKMAEMLFSFSAVTVREEKGLIYCKEMGIDARRVIDPTGLLTKEDYLNIADIPEEKDYILLYLLGNYTDVNIDDIYSYAKIKHLKIKYIASQARNDKYEKIFPSPTEWLGLISKAKYILTNSYHCCMFGIYFEKPFMFFELKGIFRGMNSRMETLISQYAVPRVRRLEELDFCEFDYSKIYQTLNRDRNEGRKMLQSWFS